MKRHIAGLQSEARHEGDLLEGVFLVRVDGARYCWHLQKSFFSIHFSILEPKELASRAVAGRLYCTPKALWRLNWFLRDFGYDPDLLGREEVDEKALLGLRGVVRTVRKTFARRSYSTWIASRLPVSGRPYRPIVSHVLWAKQKEIPMIYSYTQISQYLRCPRLYRYRYLDGWREKDTRASMVFGRCFEKALAAYFHKEDCGVALYKEWAIYKDAALEYGKGDSWDRLLQQGVHLLHLFAQQDRVCIPQPNRDLQLKITRAPANGSEFVAFVDAIGQIDGKPHFIDWKTTTSRYTEEPEGLWALDPQLICYSWMSGIRDVAMVVFVRKRLPEIQYLKASITKEQQKEYGHLVETTISQIESGLFPSHSGIRFPMNGCTSCAHLGLCLKNQQLIDSVLIRRPGASELDWLDQLTD